MGSVVDDVEVVCVVGIFVKIVGGSEDNIKIIGFDDFVWVEVKLRMIMDIWLGNGFDVYCFIDGDYVWLCGV